MIEKVNFMVYDSWNDGKACVFWDVVRVNRFIHLSEGAYLNRKQIIKLSFHTNLLKVTMWVVCTSEN